MSSQDDNGDVSEDVKRLVSDIIARNSLKKACTIKYYPGSEEGDGYATKTIAADINDGETSIKLFIKCALPDIEKVFPLANAFYDNETYFYKTVHPTYTEFCKSKGVTDGFRNAPMCYGYNETKGFQILALENLRKKGFTLFERYTCMNDEHLKLTLTVFAKFHAISFAIKDQRKDLHDQFSEHCPNLMASGMVPNMASRTIKAFIDKLDAIEDKDILDRCENLHSRAYDHIKNISDSLKDYSIFTKGDCWVNNMMLLYENDDRNDPKDVMLIDWKAISPATPIHDLGALFYSVASKETVENYNYYLDMYHEELSRRIKELGSNPDVLYPRSVFQKEWINYGLYSLGLGLSLIKIMLSTKDDAPNMEKVSNIEEMEDSFANVTHDEEQYLIRAKYIVRHMIKIGVI